MGKFLLRRLLNYLVLIAIAASAGFLLASSTLNPRENYAERNPPPPKSSIDQILDEANQNDEVPVSSRFKKWASGIVKADFGKSLDGDPIWPEMKRRMGVSLRLLILGSLVGTALGILAGAWSAVRQYEWPDNLFTVFSFVMLSTPVFLTAILLKVAAVKFNNAVDSTFFFYTGEFDPGLDGGWLEKLVDRFQHLILPSLSIILGSMAGYSRYQRASMLDVVGADFIRTARAKGLSRRRALLKHGLRTALIPMATFFAYGFTLLITGATFTEKLFGWHGMGEWFIDSVNNQDINIVSAVVVFSAVLVLIAGMIADLAYAALDPRVRSR